MHPKRKKHDIGEYYTPKSIAYYLTMKSILYYLHNNKSYSLEKNINLSKKPTNLWREKIAKLNILDPSCGDGVFLKTATTILFDLNRKLDNNDILSEKRPEKSVLEEIIAHNIHGVDINKYKIKKSNLNFINEFKMDDSDSKLYPIKNGNALIEDSGFPSYFNWNKEYKSIMKDGGFDLIIGNPPWGADMNKYKSYLCSKYPKIAVGQFDSFAIFIYKAIKDLLNDNGILAFVIPNELCFLDQYKKLREYLLNFTLLELINLGFHIFPNVQKPTLLLILKKVKNKKKTNNILVSVGHSHQEKTEILANQKIIFDLIEKNHYLRSQIEFSKNKNFLFDIFSDPTDRMIMEKINSNDFKNLGDYFRSGRGIDTNKRGKYFICPKCKSLNPPFGRGHSGRITKKECQSRECSFLFEKQNISDYETIELISDEVFPQEGYNAPGYIGEDLGKLHFKRNPRAILYCPKNLKEYSKIVPFNCSNVMWGKNELYHGEKLLIRKVSTGHNLQVTVHNGEFLVTNQQIYIFKKKEHIKNVSLYYFLGLLISRIIHYYYLNKFGDPYKKVLPHFTQSNLKSLPIPLISEKDYRYKRIVAIVRELIALVSTYQNHNTKMKDKLTIQNKINSELTRLYSQLDEIIFTIYNINNKRFQKEIIERANIYGFELI